MLLYINIAIAAVFGLILILAIGYAIKCMKAPKVSKHEIETSKATPIAENKEEKK